MIQLTTSHDMTTLVTTEVMTHAKIDRHKLDNFWRVACLVKVHIVSSHFKALSMSGLKVCNMSPQIPDVTSITNKTIVNAQLKIYNMSPEKLLVQCKELSMPGLKIHKLLPQISYVRSSTIQSILNTWA